MIIHNNSIKELNGKDAAEISVNQYDGNKIPHHTMHNQGNEEQNRVVSFYPKVMVNRITHHKDYTQEEKLGCWYLKSEHIQMKKEYQQVVHLVLADELEQKEHNHDEHCFRGLENFMAKRSLERRRVIMGARKEVLLEKAIQRHFQQGEGGGKDMIRNNPEESIAARYMLFSNYSAFEAYNVGLTDEVAAFRVQSSEEGMMITTKLVQPNETKTPNKDSSINIEKKSKKKLQRDRRRALFVTSFKKYSESFRKRFSLNNQTQDINWPVTL